MSTTVASLKLHFWNSLISCGCATVVCAISVTLRVLFFVRRQVRLMIRR